MASDLGESFGNNRVISLLETTACTTADKPKPRMSGHKISHSMANAIQSAWPRAAATSIVSPHKSKQPEGRLSPIFVVDACRWSRAALGPRHLARARINLSAASCRRLGSLHVFGVFAEARLA